MGPHFFLGRRYAGKLLATRLEEFRDTSPLVIALSPGGSIVADAVAAALGARLALWSSPTPDVRSRTVIAIDDGVIVADSARVSLRSIRARMPAQLVFAVPVANRSALLELRGDADQVFALQVEEALPSIASRYRSIREVSWDEARELVEGARARTSCESTRKIRIVSQRLLTPV